MDLIDQREGKGFVSVITGQALQLEEVANGKGVGPQVTVRLSHDRREPGLLGKLRHNLPDKS